MSTREQIRSQVRVLLKETDSANSNFTDPQINEIINQGVRYLGTLVEYPFDDVQYAADASAETYAVPADFVFLKDNCSFGDTAIVGDNRPLQVISARMLSIMYPGWRENTASVRGRPLYIILVNRNEFMVYPKVSTEFAGKPIIVSYCYVPKPLAVDTDEPELPLCFHDAVQFYVAHICYINLGNVEKSAEYLSKFNTFWKSIEDPAIKGTEQAHQFEWQVSEDL